MKDYIVINHSDGTAPPATREEWGAFFQMIKDHVVDGGKPLAKVKAAVKDGVAADASDTAVGYLIIKAGSLNEATKLIMDASPLANKPGCEVRIYETVQM